MARPLYALTQAFAAAAVLAALAAAYGITGRLGAHPFWAGQVVWIGLAGGVVIFGLSLRAPRLSFALAVVLTVAGALSARFGKQVFAASYAENALAGRFWYFGWMALCAGIIALSALAVIRYTAGRARR